MFSVSAMLICNRIHMIKASKMHKKKITYHHKRSVVDPNSGEVISNLEEKVVRLPSEPPFVKMYLDDISQIVGLTPRYKSLLMLMIRKMDYECMITLTPRTRKIMAQELGLGDGSFRNDLTDLVKTGIVRRVASNEFQANPIYFARGDWSSVCKKRREFVMQVKYKTDGTREVTTGSTEIQNDLFDEFMEK